MGKKYFIITLITLIFTSGIIHSQSNRERARWKGEEGVKLVESGYFVEGMRYLKEAVELDPESYEWKLWYAASFYYNIEYLKAIDIFEELMNHKDLDDRLYQYLGNSYSMLGNKEKAFAIYEEGLKKFPNSGRMLLEKGVYYRNRKEYSKALDFFEKGIKAEPSYPSNYFWAAKIYLGSELKLFGLIYAEIFMNLERNTQRTLNISQNIYDVYDDNIERDEEIEKFGNLGSKFFYMTDDTAKNLKLFFKVDYDTVMTRAIRGIKDIDINSIDKIRTRFLEYYFSGNLNNKYRISIFDYMKTIKDAGHLEAYNHWILMKGDERDFVDWYKKNKSKFDNFDVWFKTNRFSVDSTNVFVASEYWR
jgi:tetratricopeptide (TPR) repeat protein